MLDRLMMTFTQFFCPTDNDELLMKIKNHVGMPRILYIHLVSFISPM